MGQDTHGHERVPSGSEMSASAREARQANAKSSPAMRARAAVAPGRPGGWRRQCIRLARIGLVRGDAVSSPTVARRHLASLGLRRAEPEMGWAEGSATSAQTLRPEQQPRSAQKVTCGSAAS